MSYLSWDFLNYFVCIVFLYYLLPHRFQGYILLLSSLYFYISYEPIHFIYLFTVALTTFLFSKEFQGWLRKKTLLVICLAVNILIWLLTKDFFDWALSPRVQKSLLFSSAPIGISYYLMQAISYTVDVYKGKIQPETKFWRYLLFLSYFPIVVQGPISRYEELAPKLATEKKFNADVFISSLLEIGLGIIKKMVVADRLALFANYTFTYTKSVSGNMLYIGVICFALQLYLDFSACVDICRGVSKMLGIELRENFNSPYFSLSIKEFWNRWHLSLSTWLRDYVYIPLGGNRKGTLRKNANLLATFAVSGIWHGTGVNYLVWGLLNAVYQIVGAYTLKYRQLVKSKLHVEPKSFSERFYQFFIG